MKEDLRDIFLEKVRGNRDLIALNFKDQNLTYGEFCSQVLKVAAYLNSLNIENSYIVPIVFKRSLDMMIAIYGIIMAGAAYLPIDPNTPIDRIKKLMKDCSGKLVITDEDNVKLFNEAITIEIITRANKRFTKRNYSLDQLAYIIYTSGTTGMPKGVMIEHGALFNRINWMQKAYPLSRKDVLIQKTPYFFDVSVWEIFWWFLGESMLCIIDSGAERFPQILNHELARKNISVIHFIPSMFSVYISYISNSNIKQMNCLRRIFFSGEKLETKHIQNAITKLGTNTRVRLTNLYGPTEATVDVTFYDIDINKPIPNNLPIGKPIDNIRIKDLDFDSMNEIMIGGVGLARGYLNRVELTTEKFFVDSLSCDLYYKTGDYGKLNTNNDILYLGRKDQQVKVRGIRIEIEEIEAVIATYPKVVQCKVLLHRVKENIVYIKAFVVSGELVDSSEIKRHASKNLPEYMCPNFFYILKEFPRLPNGKMDVNGLLAMKN